MHGCEEFLRASGLGWLGSCVFILFFLYFIYLKILFSFSFSFEIIIFNR